MYFLSHRSDLRKRLTELRMKGQVTIYVLSTFKLLTAPLTNNPPNQQLELLVHDELLGRPLPKTLLGRLVVGEGASDLGPSMGLSVK